MHTLSELTYIADQISHEPGDSLYADRPHQPRTR